MLKLFLTASEQVQINSECTSLLYKTAVKETGSIPSDIYVYFDKWRKICSPVKLKRYKTYLLQ